MIIQGQAAATTFPGLTLKAWASISANGTLLKGFNVTSITKGSVGIYTLNFTNPMTTINYSLRCQVSGFTNVITVYETAKTTGSIQLNYYIQAGALNTDLALYVEVWE
jgi:hypothetical protein